MFQLCGMLSGRSSDGTTEDVQKSAEKSRPGHARIQARPAQIGRPEEGEEPETGDRHRPQRGPPLRRECPSEKRDKEEIGVKEEVLGEKNRGQKDSQAQDSLKEEIAGAVLPWSAPYVVRGSPAPLEQNDARGNGYVERRDAS